MNRTEVGRHTPFVHLKPAELDIHIVEAEASIAALKGLLADGEIPGEEG